MGISVNHTNFNKNAISKLYSVTTLIIMNFFMYSNHVRYIVLEGFAQNILIAKNVQIHIFT